MFTVTAEDMNNRVFPMRSFALPKDCCNKLKQD